MRIFHSPEVEIEVTTPDTDDLLKSLGFSGDRDLEEQKEVKVRTILVSVARFFDDMRIRVVPTRLD